MKIAIVGSRDFADMQKVKDFVHDFLPADDVEIVSGGARGVDSWAVEQAQQDGIRTKVFPADWSQGRGAGLARNQAIVDYADIIIAFWDGQSRGTMDTVRKAQRAGKFCDILR